MFVKKMIDCKANKKKDKLVERSRKRFKVSNWGQSSQENGYMTGVGVKEMLAAKRMRGWWRWQGFEGDRARR